MKRLEETQEVFGSRPPRTGWRRMWSFPLRGRLFIILLVLSATAGLGFTFARAPVYRSVATLLVEPARNRADSLRSQDGQANILSAPPDNQQVLATERQRFLSAAVVAQVAQQFTAELRTLGAELNPEAGLQALLNIEYDAATNLIQLALEEARDLDVLELRSLECDLRSLPSPSLRLPAVESAVGTTWGPPHDEEG